MSVRGIPGGRAWNYYTSRKLGFGGLGRRCVRAASPRLMSLSSLPQERLSSGLSEHIVSSCQIQPITPISGHSSKPKKKLPSYSWKEISTHCTAESCWLVVRGKVYDVTSFLEKHPGSPQAILKHAGTDATVDFDFHSSSAQKLWQKHLIGYVEGENSRSSCVIL
jgi:hypothetical protein